MTIQTVARKNLLLVAHTYRRATKLSLSTVSLQFHGRGKFFEDFQKGRCSITLSKLEEMLVDFSDRWPPEAKWPKLQPIRMARSKAKRRRRIRKNINAPVDISPPVA